MRADSSQAKYKNDSVGFEYYMLFGPQLPRLLRWDDRISMAHSIKTRSPFLNSRFVEIAVNIPPEHKLSNGYTKNLMREYMRNKMPPEVTWRTNKMGFNAPTEKWGKNFDVCYVNGLFTNPRSGAYFEVEKIRKLYNQKADHHLVQTFFALEIFMRLFDVRPAQ